MNGANVGQDYTNIETIANDEIAPAPMDKLDMSRVG